MPKNNIISLPTAIIVAALLIAIAIIWNKAPAPTVKDQSSGQRVEAGKPAPITLKDHILGNPNAKIIVLEYSDTSCPFCKSFHTTMNKIMDEYGKTGNVAWVYRHFPLDNIHINARNEANATECAASLGGNDKFWAYINKLYETTPSVTSNTPEGLDQSELPKIASSIGLDRKSFEECLSSNRFKDRVDANYIDGVNAGVSATPFNLLITKSGKTIPVIGAEPYAQVKYVIDSLLKTE